MSSHAAQQLLDSNKKQEKPTFISQKPSVASTPTPMPESVKECPSRKPVYPTMIKSSDPSPSSDLLKPVLA